MDELTRSEALDRAFDALRDGAGSEDVLSRLPEDLRPLFAAARRLEHAGQAPTAIGPSATFVLSLEEQLRTDMRLHVADLPSRLWSGWRIGVLVTALFVGAGALVLRGNDVGSFEPTASERAPDTIDSALRRLDEGWVGINTLRQDLRHSDPASSGLAERLGAITTAFEDALDATDGADDPRTVARVRADVEAAAAALAGLAHGRSDAVRDEIIESRRALVVRLLKSRVGSLDPAPIEPPPIIVSTALPSPTEDLGPPGGPTEPVDPSPPLPTEPIPPPATATMVPPLSTEAPSPTSTPMPIAPDPPATTRPRPTDPTPDPPDPSPIVPPTETPDRWPTEGPTKAPPEPIVPPTPGVDPSAPPPSPTEATRSPGRGAVAP